LIEFAENDDFLFLFEDRIPEEPISYQNQFKETTNTHISERQKFKSPFYMYKLEKPLPLEVETIIKKKLKMAVMFERSNAKFFDIENDNYYINTKKHFKSLVYARISW
jgi:hypothetical protein